MKIKEITEKVEQIIASENIGKLSSEYEYYGLRFENADREIGDECGNSRHNPDRLDLREFPQFGSDEYDELPELDGTSAWHIETNLNLWKQSYTDYTNDPQSDSEFPGSLAKHCYIVGGFDTGSHDDPDQNEILIKDAVVVAKIF